MSSSISVDFLPSFSIKQIVGDEIVDMTFQVLARADDSKYAKVSQTVAGTTSTQLDAVTLSEGTVREGLTFKSDPDGDLNQAELLVIHAMALTQDPVFKGRFSLSFDLSEVRFATMYQIGQQTRMGSATVVEARDANNEVLGSFLGGFLVEECK